MRHSISLLLLPFLVLLAAWPGQSHAQDVHVALPDTLISADSVGTEVLIPLSVTEVPASGVASFQFGLFADPSVATITGHETAGTLAEEEDFLVDSNSDCDQWEGATFCLVAAGSTTDPLTETGIFVFLRVAIHAEGTTPLTFTWAQANEQAVEVVPSDGSLTVIGGIAPTPVNGWRLLSPPGGGQTVGALADLNLVQGVDGSYPGADPNLYLNYDGPTSNDYTPPASTAESLTPGKGFFWYLFEESDFSGNEPPEEWVNLEDFAFPIAFGEPQEEDVAVSFDTVPETEGNDLPAYLVGNPFRAAFRLAGVSVSTGTLQTNFFAWNPENDSYIILGENDFMSPWQGVWAEVDGNAPPTFTFSADSVDAAENPPIIGLRTDEPFALSLQLRGMLDDDEEVNDLANALRFEGDALIGWDRHDGSKLLPPTGSEASMPPPLNTSHSALLAPGGMRNGALYRQSVRSLPIGLEEATRVPVAFQTTAEGSFEVLAASDEVPEGWSFTLRDLDTGVETELLESDYAFSSGATLGWEDRFEVIVTPAGVADTEDGPADFRLSNAAPNPASASTSLNLRVSESQRVTTRVYDVLGQRVTTAHNDVLAAGADVRLEVNTSGLAPGTYIIRVEGERFAEVRRVTVVK